MPIIKNRGFEVVSVQCRCGSVRKEELGAVLAAKDRVYGQAPLMAVYQSKSYHRRVLAKQTEQ